MFDPYLLNVFILLARALFLLFLLNLLQLLFTHQAAG